MNEQLRFHTLEALQALTLEDLHALWELVPTEQELSRGGELAGLSLNVQEGETGDTLQLSADVSITLHDVQTVNEGDEDVPEGQQALLFDLGINAGADDLDTSLWRVELYDGGGQLYLPNTANYGTIPPYIPSLSRIPVALGYIIPANFTDGRLVISDERGQSVTFGFMLETPVEPVQYDGVDVRLVSVTTLEGQITTRLRIYNGQTIPITFTPNDINLSLGFAPDPPGPRNPAEGMQAFELLPEQAVNLTLVWYWSGEPYSALEVGAWRWTVQLIRNPF